jgi:hypothetical protein
LEETVIKFISNLLARTIGGHSLRRMRSDALRDSRSGDQPTGRSWDEFAGQNYSNARQYDGIPDVEIRSPEETTLTTESTYRLFFYGFPEIYITAIYRWPGTPAATFLTTHAQEIGRRLGRNKLFVPLPRCEEEYWQDARELLAKADDAGGIEGTIQPHGVYLMLSGVNPQLLAERKHPYLIFDITQLTEPQITFAFSMLLDLFDNRLERPRSRKPSPGALLVAGALDVQHSALVERAVKVLAEITLVLKELTITYIGFPWEVGKAVVDAKARLESDADAMARVRATRLTLERLALNEPEPRVEVQVNQSEPSLARSHESLWLWVGSTSAVISVGLASIAVGLYAARTHYGVWFTWPMVAAYLTAGLAIFFFAGAVRDWRFPLTRVAVLAERGEAPGREPDGDAAGLDSATPGGQPDENAAGLDGRPSARP